jgi:hypothetical protein
MAKKLGKAPLPKPSANPIANDKKPSKANEEEKKSNSSN